MVKNKQISLLCVLTALGLAAAAASASGRATAQPIATHLGQDLAEAHRPEVFSKEGAFLGSDKVEFTLMMEQLGVETNAGADLAAAFSLTVKRTGERASSSTTQ
jgi:hypothetical protein